MGRSGHKLSRDVIPTLVAVGRSLKTKKVMTSFVGLAHYLFKSTKPVEILKSFFWTSDHFRPPPLMLPSLLDLLFPRHCLGCGKTGSYFCASCLNLVVVFPERICPVCQKGSFGGITHPGCARPQGLDGLTTVFAYGGLIEKAIKKIKYHFVSDLSSELVELFLSFIGEDKTFAEFCREKPILIPIPLHAARLRWRGFNQSELLGRLIAENLGLDFAPDLLARVKNTQPQVELDKEKRGQNIKGAFSLAPSILVSQSPSILLFDDVWTSGATLREAAKVLKRAGTTKVWGLTLAR